MPADLQTALRILLDEAKDGFRDRKVIGGLAGFFANLVKRTSDEQVQKAAALLQDYGTLDHDRRVGRVDAVLKMLEQSPPRANAEVAVPRTGDLAASTQEPQPTAPAKVPKTDRPWTWQPAPSPG